MSKVFLLLAAKAAAIHSSIHGKNRWDSIEGSDPKEMLAYSAGTAGIDTADGDFAAGGAIVEALEQAHPALREAPSVAEIASSQPLVRKQLFKKVRERADQDDLMSSVFAKVSATAEKQAEAIVTAQQA